ncbi:unnamed protein product [Miscanthus lutarioriparius]|uniref:Phospholipase A1 n=1 Tax=Miscanthus lutarioriparius TaxID=422564 RepID=A0A811SPP5_9POAL|nr:unnamed protein product [Miscanthus lutarioriparius]
MSQHGDLGGTAGRWREVHGVESSWAGLLDMLDLDLHAPHYPPLRRVGAGDLLRHLQLRTGSPDSVRQVGWPCWTFSSSGAVMPWCTGAGSTPPLTPRPATKRQCKASGVERGAELATLNTFNIAANDYNVAPCVAARTVCPVTVFAFTSPRVGSSGFKKQFDAIPELRLLRACNAYNVVVRASTRSCMELAIDTGKSRALPEEPGHEQTWHNLEVYLRLRGYAGCVGGGFELATARDAALVNKAYDALRNSNRVVGAVAEQGNGGGSGQNGE